MCIYHHGISRKRPSRPLNFDDFSVTHSATVWLTCKIKHVFELYVALIRPLSRIMLHVWCFGMPTPISFLWAHAWLPHGSLAILFLTHNDPVKGARTDGAIRLAPLVSFQCGRGALIFWRGWLLNRIFVSLGVGWSPFHSLMFPKSQSLRSYQEELSSAGFGRKGPRRALGKTRIKTSAIQWFESFQKPAELMPGALDAWILLVLVLDQASNMSENLQCFSFFQILWMRSLISH